MCVWLEDIKREQKGHQGRAREEEECVRTEARRRGDGPLAASSAAPAANRFPAASGFMVSLTRDGGKNTPPLSASPRLCANQSSYRMVGVSLDSRFRGRTGLRKGVGTGRAGDRKGGGEGKGGAVRGDH